MLPYSAPPSCTLSRTRIVVGACALVIAVLSAYPLSMAAAERPDGGAEPVPVLLTRGPAKPGFDITRFVAVEGGTFQTFHVTETQPVRQALDRGLVAGDTSLLVTDVEGGLIALLVEQMAYHHIAQGRTKGREWLVSFCVVCNTGTRLVPVVGGQPSRFEAVGAYDALFVMQDADTKTLWNHITGEALYGPRVGTSLGPVGNVLQMNVRQALAVDPQMRVAISDRFYVAGGRVHGTAQGFMIQDRHSAERPRGDVRLDASRSTNTAPRPEAALSDVFRVTLGQEDPRRPRMDLGIGIWTSTTKRYYPMADVRRNGNVLLDRIDGRTVLVYIDSDTSIPSAVYVETARAERKGDTVHLDNGQVLSAGVLKDSRGQRLAMDRPQQLFTRWYGFALTFPGTEVFGGE